MMNMIFVKEFTAWRDGIDQQIIEFLAERKIKRENFIRNIHRRKKKIDDLNYENFYGRYDEGQ